jgi:hypothetical protein
MILGREDINHESRKKRRNVSRRGTELAPALGRAFRNEMKKIYSWLTSPSKR